MVALWFSSFCSKAWYRSDGVIWTLLMRTSGQLKAPLKIFRQFTLFSSNVHLQFLWCKIINIYFFKGTLYGCLWHLKPPKTVVVLGYINKLSVACHVWNLMFPIQMVEKKKKGQSIASLIFYFLRIVKTSLFPFPVWTLQADAVVILEMANTEWGQIQEVTTSAFYKWRVSILREQYSWCPLIICRSDSMRCHDWPPTSLSYQLYWDKTQAFLILSYSDMF